MPNRALTRPVGQEGFVGITGTAPRSGTIMINSITPRISLYCKIGVRPDFKITPTMALPITVPFVAGEEFQAMATDDLVVNYTLTLD